MTCSHCTHSTGLAVDWHRPPMLWCTRHRTTATRVCADFAYEPGAAE